VQVLTVPALMSCIHAATATGVQVREARMEAQMQAANQMIAEKDAFVRKTFHEIRTPCHILLQVSNTKLCCLRTKLLCL
jgi:signal transduction histidine kinase